MHRDQIVSLLIYAAGQAIGYAIDLSIFSVFMLLNHGRSPIAAHLAGKFGSAALTYVYHSRYSFPGEKARGRATSTLAYIATVGFNIVFTTVSLRIALMTAPSAPFAAKIVCDVAGVVVTYLLMRSVVFRRVAAR